MNSISRYTTFNICHETSAPLCGDRSKVADVGQRILSEYMTFYCRDGVFRERCDYFTRLEDSFFFAILRGVFHECLDIHVEQFLKSTLLLLVDILQKRKGFKECTFDELVSLISVIDYFHLKDQFKSLVHALMLPKNYCQALIYSIELKVANAFIPGNLDVELFKNIRIIDSISFFKKIVLFRFLKNHLETLNPDVQFLIGYCTDYGIGTFSNESEALKYYKLSADQGNAWGQNALGYCYHHGIGTSKDESKAFRYYKLSADQGNARGQNDLGYCYHHGIGTSKDESEAFRYYKLSADQGNAAGQSNLGYCYLYGIGISKDESEAFRYYKLLADQGNARGQNDLGYCYYHGIGTSKDESEAFRYYKLSADQGDDGGQYNLGSCYYNGTGTEKNQILAKKYYKLSAEQGLKEAKDALKDL